MRIIVVALLLSIASTLGVTLYWDMEGNPLDLGGCIVHAGRESGKPLILIDVGKNPEWNADDFLADQPAGTTCFFMVTAYNTKGIEGLPSNEVTYLVPDVTVPEPTPSPAPVPIIPPHTHSWDEITGKPDTFPNAPHTHPIPSETGIGQ